MAPVKRSGDDSRRRRGFTLVELTTVIVLAGILAATALPVFARVAALRAAGAAGTLAGHLRLLQTRAMAGHLRTWMVFDAAAGECRGYVEDPERPGRSFRVPAVDPLTRGALVMRLGEDAFGGIRIDTVDINGGMEVGFDSFGVPYDSEERPLTREGLVRFADGTTLTITPDTGYAALGP